MNKRIKLKKGLLQKKCNKGREVQYLLQNESKVMHKFNITLRNGVNFNVECKKIKIVRNESGQFIEFYSTGSYTSYNLNSILNLSEITE